MNERGFPYRGCRAWRWLVALGFCLLASPAGAQVLAVRGAGGTLWLVRSPAGADAITVYQRSINDPSDQLHLAGSRTGPLAPGGMAAQGHQLWLVYRGLVVQHVTVAQGQTRQMRQFSFEPMPPLPHPSSLRAMTAVDGQPWILLRIDSAKALTAIDRQNARTQPTTQSTTGSQTPGPATMSQHRAMGPAPTTALSHRQAASKPATQSTVATQSGEASHAKSFQPVDRLFVLRSGRWRRIVLPRGWQSHTAVYMVGQPNAQYPTLIRELASSGGKKLVIARWTPGHWVQQQITIPGHGAMQALAVDRQLVIARRDASRAGVTIKLFVIRANKVFPVGGAALKTVPTDSAWGVAPVGDSVGLFAADGSSAKAGQPRATQPGAATHVAAIAWWTAADLNGHITQPATPMHLARGRINPYRSAQFVVLLIVLVISVGLIFLFWRRDPTSQKIDLPSSLTVAPLSTRLMAAIIDFVPGMIIVMLVFGLGPIQLLFHHWPGSGWSQDWQSMIPGLVTIGLFVGYTAIAEAGWGRTLGKWIMGLEVTALDGTPVGPWPAVVRCLLKALDLIAWVLLILPVINPSRQRLGDMIARTVVVHHRVSR